MEQNNSLDLTSAVMADACHLRIPSQPDWISPTVDYLIQRALRCGAVEPDRDRKLMIALHEALTNSIIHGNLGISSMLKELGDETFFRALAERMADPERAARVVDIQATYDGKSARWVFHDQGVGFDTQAVLRKLEEEVPNPDQLSGRGLLLMKAFTDELHYDDYGRRLVLTIRRKSEQERRRQPRWSVSEPLQVIPLDQDGQAIESEHGAVSRNFSLGGMSFLVDGLSPTKWVRLTIPSDDRPVEVLAEVRRWQSLGGNVVEVGCRFETPEPPAPPEPQSARLEELMQRLTGKQTPQSERRSMPRVPYTETIEVELPDGQIRRGYGRDISHGGIAFVCAGVVPLDVVQIRLWVGESEPIVVRARVVRATKLIEGFHDIGAQFLPG
jgi:anti-sigma regulatory factor (Ser/Thr protein kinase)